MVVCVVIFFFFFLYIGGRHKVGALVVGGWGGVGGVGGGWEVEVTFEQKQHATATRIS